jgi:pimeloyl-ACP methyl ester carboxylesterase
MRHGIAAAGGWHTLQQTSRAHEHTIVPAASLLMTKPNLVSDVRGASRIVVDLTLVVTDLVETMHHNIARLPGIAGEATFARTKGITGLVYRSVRAVTRLVGAGIDTALAPLAPLLKEPSTWPGREPFVAALNGVLGDHLAASHNPLAIAMHLRAGGAPLALTADGIAAAVREPRARVVVLVHGLCMSDANWERQGHDHGRKLAGDLDASALYLRYNTGLHVADNGEALSGLLAQLVERWPVPQMQLVLVGHSMGGLVIRSAYAAAERAGHAWRNRVRALAFLGTPHHGAPLERGGQGIDLLLAASPYTAAFTRLSRMRSAGITDLRHGTVRAEDRQGDARFDHHVDARTPLPLPANVPCFTIAGSLSKTAPRTARLPRGDGLVPVASALGRHPDARMQLDFPPSRQHIALGTGHLDLLCSAPVYRKLRDWLREAPQS